MERNDDIFWHEDLVFIDGEKALFYYNLKQKNGRIYADILWDNQSVPELKEVEFEKIQFPNPQKKEMVLKLWEEEKKERRELIFTGTYI